MATSGPVPVRDNRLLKQLRSLQQGRSLGDATPTLLFLEALDNIDIFVSTGQLAL